MKKSITFSIDETVLNSFLLAVSISNKLPDDVFEYLAKYYSVSTLQKINDDAFENNTNLDIPSHVSSPIVRLGSTSLSKAKKKIPIWASKTHQTNSQIIKAYFLAEQNGYASRKKMCTIFLRLNPNKTETQFQNNLASMGTDKSHSHGHVFDFLGDEVHITESVKNMLLLHKNKFI